MSFSLVATPACYIDVYPFEGGSFTINGDNGLLRSLTTETNIRTSAHTFSMQLVAGGPFGPNARPGWLDILTPMSLVVIAMQRAGRAQIVMIGVVRTVQQTEVWIPNQGVQRALQVSGYDFAYFFSLENFYSQSLLNLSTPGLSIDLATASLSTPDNGLLSGTPDSIGKAWYNTIMAGPQGLMAALTFAYQGSRPTFSSLMGTLFEAYSQADISIPFGDNFMVAEGSWDQKFREIFPFPWYEFFVTTAPVGTYPGSQAASFPLSSVSLPSAGPASPQVVARVNPLPRLVNTSSTGSPTFAMDFSLWDALPIFTLDTSGPIQQTFQFDDAEARNFYVLNPMWVSNLIGVTNDMQIPFTFLFGAWVDTASIHRYGYRPEISELHWWYDPHGIAAQGNAAAGVGLPEFETLVGDLALKKIGHHEPTPNMARATVLTNLRPDILPGNRFAYTPFKDNQLWDFYIEGVTHNWVFGGGSTTQLTLSRGLPDTVYNDDAMMVALHTGNAQRINGQYVIGLPPGLGPPLQPINYNNREAITGGIAAIFAAPQTK